MTAIRKGASKYSRQSLKGEISLILKHPKVYEVSSLEDVRVEPNISPTSLLYASVTQLVE